MLLSRSVAAAAAADGSSFATTISCPTTLCEHIESVISALLSFRPDFNLPFLEAATPCASCALSFCVVPQRMPSLSQIEKLGEGTYGVVYKATDRLRGNVVALKKVRMDAWEEGVPAIALREIAVLKQVRCANVVSYVEHG